MKTIAKLAAIVVLFVLVLYIIVSIKVEPKPVLKEANLTKRDYQFDIYGTTITLYRGDGKYYVGECSIDKLDSLLTEDNK